MRFETTLHFVRDRVIMEGEFYHERQTGRTQLFVGKWTTNIYSADWDALSCRVLEYTASEEKQDFKKWLLEGR